MKSALLRVLLLLAPLVWAPLGYGGVVRGPARGSKPGRVAFAAPLGNTGAPVFAALTANPQVGLKNLLTLAKDAPKVWRPGEARPPQASYLLGLLADPKLITSNREFFTAAIGADNARTLESAAKAIAKKSKKDGFLAQLVSGIHSGTYFSRSLGVRQAADLLGVWFDGSSLPKGTDPSLGRSLTAAVSGLKPAGAPKTAPSRKPKRTPSLLGRPRIDPSLKGVPKDLFSNPFYHNARGKLRSIEYGTPVSREMGKRTVHSLSYPYRQGGKLVIDLLVEPAGRGPNMVKTVLIATLKKTDLPSFKKYWLQGGISGIPPIKVPSRRANRYLLGWPKLVEGSRVLVEVSGKEYWFDLDRLYLANLYQPDNSLDTLMRLTEAGGEGYIIRADYFKKQHNRDKNPAYYFGELVVVTKAPDAGRKPSPIMKGAEPKLSLFHKPGFGAALAELGKMGVQVAFGDFEGVSGVYLPQSNEGARFLKKRFAELRAGKLGMIFLSAKDTLDTLHHEKSHALDRIHLMPEFAKAMKALEIRDDFTHAQISVIWTYLTEQRAYTESHLQLKKEGRLKPTSTWDFGPTAEGAREDLTPYREALIRVLGELSPEMGQGLRAILDKLTRPDLKGFTEFQVPGR